MHISGDPPQTRGASIQTRGDPIRGCGASSHPSGGPLFLPAAEYLGIPHDLKSRLQNIAIPITTNVALMPMR